MKVSSHYGANWKTSGLVDGAVYRLQVFSGAFLLGFLDVVMVERVGQKSRDVVEIKLGSTVPVNFRIEAGATTLLPIESVPLIQATRQLLTSADPVSASVELLKQYFALLSKYGAEEGGRQLNAIVAEAVDPVEDSAAIRALNQKLAGHFIPAPQEVFNFRSDRHSFSLSSTGSIPSGTTRTPVAWIYVNGIDTSPVQALANFASIKWLTTGLGWADNAPSPRAGYLFYNETAGFYGDLVESAIQLIALQVNYPNLIEPVAAAFRDTLSRTLQDRAIVVFAHSQGNLITQQAVRNIDFPGCVGVVSIAPPTSSNWSQQIAIRATVMAKGALSEDLLLYKLSALPHNDATIETSRTRQYDALLAASVGEVEEYNTDLHSVGDHYLIDPVSRPVIRQNLELVDEITVDGCGKIIFLPSSLSLNEGESFSIQSAVSTKLLGTALPERGSKTRYLSRDSAVARVVGTGSSATVVGVRVGSTYILASNGPVRDSVSVVVGGCGSDGPVANLCSAVSDANSRVLPKFSNAASAEEVGKKLRALLAAIRERATAAANQALADAESILSQSAALLGDAADIGSVKLVLDAARTLM